MSSMGRGGFREQAVANFAGTLAAAFVVYIVGVISGADTGTAC